VAQSGGEGANAPGGKILTVLGVAVLLSVFIFFLSQNNV